MSSSASDDNPGGETPAAIDSLRQEIAALQHELRRVNDARERGPSHALEQRARLLRDNIKLCQRDLERALSRLPDRPTRE